MRCNDIEMGLGNILFFEKKFAKKCPIRHSSKIPRSIEIKMSKIEFHEIKIELFSKFTRHRGQSMSNKRSVIFE